MEKALAENLELANKHAEAYTKEYSDSKAQETLESSKGYTDTKTEAAKSFATSEANAAISTAKTYSDGKLTEAKNYTDALDEKVYGETPTAVKKATADQNGDVINTTYAKIARLNTVCGHSLYSTTPENIDDLDLNMNFISGVHVDENELVLNQNFKTLNGESIYGEGDIPYIYNAHIVSDIEEIDGELNYKFDYATINGQPITGTHDITIDAASLGVYTKEEVDALIESIDIVIPGEGGNINLSDYAKLSDLEEYVKEADLKFATKEEILDLVDREEVENLISEIETQEKVDLTTYATKEDIKDFVTLTTLDNYVTIDQAFSGDYNDLTNKPTKLSEFTNDLPSNTTIIYSGSGTGTLTVSSVASGKAFIWYGKHNGKNANAVVVFTADHFGKTAPARFGDWDCGIIITKNSDTSLTFTGEFDYSGNKTLTTYKIVQLA